MKAGETPNVSGEFVMKFGKHIGRTLEEIAETEPSYILWLAEEKVLKIDPEFLDAVQQDEMEADSELKDIINEYRD
jgi:hypothetical protein